MEHLSTKARAAMLDKEDIRSFAEIMKWKMKIKATKAKVYYYGEKYNYQLLIQSKKTTKLKIRQKKILKTLRSVSRKQANEKEEQSYEAT